VLQHGRIQVAGEMVQVAAQAGHGRLKRIRLPRGARIGGQVRRL
jgi:hypothetical protein